jgi:hypothetical protein
MLQYVQLCVLRKGHGEGGREGSGRERGEKGGRENEGGVGEGGRAGGEPSPFSPAMAKGMAAHNILAIELPVISLLSPRLARGKAPNPVTAHGGFPPTGDLMLVGLDTSARRDCR